MGKVTTYTVVPKLPPRLERLLTIANNVWWCWDPGAIELFIRIDRDLWTQTNQNPKLVLGMVSQLRLEQLAPAAHGKRILAGEPKARAGEMQPRQRFAERGAMRGVWVVDGIAVEKGDDRRRPAGETAQSGSGVVSDRQRTGHPRRREMLHQPEEKRKISLGDTLFIKREDKAPGVDMQVEIGVFDALGDAFAG